MGIPVDRKRNVSLIAHSGAGKTTLAEAMLFTGKSIARRGSVDDGTTHIGGDPEEIKHKISLSSSIHHIEWEGMTSYAGCRINLIDTPGYSDFLSEARTSLRVAGGAVVVLSAISGVKPQTEKIWEFADEFEAVRVAFVNKMDRERASFLRAVDDMERVLKVKGVPVQMPIGEGEAFSGIVDLVAMKAYYYRQDASGVYEARDVPPELAKDAAKMRDALVAVAVESDDGLTEKYLSGAEITQDELRSCVREAALTRRFVPVALGSASKVMGVNLLMDLISYALPSPVDKGRIRGVIKGIDPRTNSEAVREPREDAPFSALVFKTMIDPFTGKLSVFRIYSGSLHPDSVVYNPARGVKEKIAHIYALEGRKAVEVKATACPGDIVAAAKLKDTFTGDTLCDPANPIVFEPPSPPGASLSYAINPRTKADEDKAPAALAKLMEEDPALEYRTDAQTKEFVLSGAGQVHLEVSVERLKRKYGCDVELKTPRIPYMETIRSHARVQGRYKKQSGGRGQYGDVWLDIRPLPRGGGFEFKDEITGGAIPRQYIPAVEKGIIEAKRTGALAGFPVVDIMVSLYDGSYHSVDSSEMSFKVAASIGFKKGMEQAHPVLLEPVMKLEINLPDDCLGECLGDINARRGKVLGAEPSSGGQTVRALVPMAELITYATDLKGMTGDRGIFTMEFSHYTEVPVYLSQKIIDGQKAEKE